ncbi:Na/Pi cotransporter family protein [Dyadobacter tibetensis]|uniref:Na/Pi cotransporter family protein n=1 Tax=Dyadobacter tibetensis TaxID=1211851 RepID=UPI000472FBB9|nr:Na/Pi symporter [Dyadobacter tibetensis]
MMILIALFMKLGAGIGLFLFAMYLLEESLTNLSGRKFKLFIQRTTNNRLAAVGAGALVTAILQSSSMVSLIVLALVGAGVFSMRNALAIILGANLGTTVSSWLVATLGFKVDIEVASYPMVFLGGLLLIVFKSRENVKNFALFLLGFGLLFIGLSLMKTAIEDQVNNFDFNQYASMSSGLFLLIGFVITSLVQSSSVTMALTLSALYAGAIPFPAAAALVLGSETGTTIKIIAGALGGSASKKRVAVGNFLFNVIITLLAFLFLQPIVTLITEILKIEDPLIGLVIFSTLLNLAGIILFLPFLDPYAKFLERLFKNSNGAITAFIGNANLNEPETALYLLKKDTAYFIHNAMLFNLELFDIDTKKLQRQEEYFSLNQKRKFLSMPPKEKYIFLKQFQGELQTFFIALRSKVNSEQNAQLTQVISSLRSSMHSIKSMKDVSDNIINLSQSSNSIKYNFFSHHQSETVDLYRKLSEVITEAQPDALAIQGILAQIQENYSQALNNFYQEAQNIKIDELDITSALNFNRELFTSNKAMLMAVKDFVLSEQEASGLNEIIYKT